MNHLVYKEKRVDLEVFITSQYVILQGREKNLSAWPLRLAYVYSTGICTAIDCCFCVIILPQSQQTSV